MTHTRLRGRTGHCVTAALTSLMLLSGMLVLDNTAQAHDVDTTICKAVEVPVTVGDQSGPIAGTLCTPPGATAVQLLVHGFTYDQHYFDSRYQPEKYSYARAANAAGYATLTIDRLGTGASMHPISAFDTFQADVRTVHGVVQALRDGSIGTQFEKVISVGHSVGSMVTSNEAAIYHDVDALIVTGFSHTLNYLNAFPKYVARAYPARSDPKFSGSIEDPAYITSFPGTKKYYYNLPNTDPAVVAEDERHKGTTNLVEIATLGGYGLLNVTHDLDIPVLTINGQKDPIFCGLAAANCGNGKELADHERPWYGKRATVEGAVIPNAGHNTVLERSAPQGINRMIRFAEKHIGHDRGAIRTEPGVRPAVPHPPRSPMSPLDRTIQAAFGKAVMPTLNAYSLAVDAVPGVGNPTANPIPGTTELLSTIGNLENELLGSIPQDILSHL